MTAQAPTSKTFGVLAEFETPAAIYHAAESVRDAGYTRWDVHTPFPVHGMDKAMGLKQSKLPWVVLVMGLTGAGGALLLQWWISAVDYPVVIGGKPFFSWQAFVPIMFELMVLFSALGAVFGMFGFNKLPRFHHPLFSSARFERVTDDKFFLSIEADDPKYREEQTTQLLQKLGASHVELVQD
ncbi:MAG: DUF3341 domain-containing protein [Deltaproteobacteria bacterium]|nr:DUF3341 domain-containing protein [Deltaproteobacteria bacterium]